MGCCQSLNPLSWMRCLRARVHKRIRRMKAPYMVWGYADADGSWRPRTRISDTVFMYHPEKMHIADNVFVWHYTILDGTGGLTINEGAQIGAWVGLFTHSSHIAIRIYGDHYQEVPEEEKEGFKTAPVTIGRYAFIAAGAKILPGVTVGDGAIVSAGAVVMKDVEPFTVVSGNPAERTGTTEALDRRYLRRNPQLQEWYDEWTRRDS